MISRDVAPSFRKTKTCKASDLLVYDQISSRLCSSWPDFWEFGFLKEIRIDKS